MCGLWILVCVLVSISNPVFQTRLDHGLVSVYKNLSPHPLIEHVWFMAPCCVQASVSTCVSNTLCDSGSVYNTSLLPCVSNTYGLWILVCVQVSVLSQNGYARYCLHGSDVNLVFLHVMSGLDYEGGDGHKHGCLDALAMTLSLRWSSQESSNERISLLFFASRRCTEQEFQHADNSNSWVLVLDPSRAATKFGFTSALVRKRCSTRDALLSLKTTIFDPEC